MTWLVVVHRCIIVAMLQILGCSISSTRPLDIDLKYYSEVDYGLVLIDRVTSCSSSFPSTTNGRRCDANHIMGLFAASELKGRMRRRSSLIHFIAFVCLAGTGRAFISNPLLSSEPAFYQPSIRPYNSRQLLAWTAHCSSAACRGDTTRLFASHRNAEVRRKELLTRRGDHFELDQGTGRIEFGATAYLVTQLDDLTVAALNGDDDNGAPSQGKDGLSLISTWLQDERGLAMSIWDPSMIEERGDNVFRLQVMSLNFLTLQVAPWVDVEMKTRTAKSGGGAAQPVFCLQSIAFDPNVQILPGMKVSAESFGIVIEVAGQLRPTEDGRGVQSAIAFQTTGKLSPPMRLLPAPALRSASAAINRRIVEFATASFQDGARRQYQEFVQTQMQKQNESSKVVT